MAENNFADVAFSGDSWNPRDIRAYCRPCGSYKTLSFEKQSKWLILSCGSCHSRERYDSVARLIVVDTDPAIRRS
jgi:hypothetical protein